MTCREVNDFLADYASGDLLPEVRSRFEAHLLECPRCVAYVRSYGEAVRLARAGSERGLPELVPDDVPEDLVAAILDSTIGRGPSGRTS